MKKTILAAALIIALCLTPLGALAADSVSSPVLTLVIPEKLPAVGETFTVAVNLSGNPGVCSLNFTVGSSNTVVECTSARIGKALEGALAASNPKASDGARIAAASAAPLKGDGTVGVLTYLVLAEGDPAFQLAGASMSGENGEDLSPSIAPLAVKHETAPAPEAGKPGDGMGGAAPPESTQPENSATVPPVTAGGTSFEPSEDDELLFSDLPAGHWSSSFVARAVEKGLFIGYPDGSFRPDAPLTRIQLLTVLWRLAGKPQAKKAAPFTDMDGISSQFQRAASWACEEGIAKGSASANGRLLKPNDPISRQQAMTLLFRYSGESPGLETQLTGTYDSRFADSASVAPYAKPALYWAVYKGYVRGVGKKRLSPDGVTTRAQMAKILVNYLEDFHSTGGE